jgi:aspartyl-tRNA(Asn)/glutamyl-tRNA(Gln) amidotransferase subunit B
LRTMDYEVVIGLEVHSQLLTESKMFCGCSSAYQDTEPNTRICPVCMGMPGVLPVINKRAVEFVIRTGLALNCDIAGYTKFDRKNYPYPDLMKGYQISQYDQPIASSGYLAVHTEDGEKKVGVTRVHLEEDVAKLFHRTEGHGEAYSLLDINRAGVPLMEIVSEPDMRSPEEARSYLTQLQSILRYIGVSTANMEEGSFRCDANISIRPQGAAELGSKVEIKNMNSFRSVYRALQYEAERQVNAVREGEKIVQETCGWNDSRGVTFPQRTKEFAHDYRYFPEPDLPPLVIAPEWVEEIREGLPELPAVKKARFMEEYGLSAYDASLLTTSRATADYFESIVRLKGLSGEKKQQSAKSVSNWILVELARLLNDTDTDIASVKIGPQQFVEMLDLIEAGTLSTSMAKTVRAIAEERGLVQISDLDSIRAAVEEAVSSNEKAVSEYLGGKETAIRFLVGQVMKITRGKANPQLANELLKEKLESLR